MERLESLDSSSAAGVHGCWCYFFQFLSFSPWPGLVNCAMLLQKSIPSLRCTYFSGVSPCALAVGGPIGGALFYLHLNPVERLGTLIRTGVAVVIWPTLKIIQAVFPGTLVWMWLVYGTIGVVGFTLCSRRAWWLALFLPVSFAFSVAGIGELRTVRLIDVESTLYFLQWCFGIVLVVGGPIGGSLSYSRFNPKKLLKTGIWTGASVFVLLTLLIIRVVFSGTMAFFVLAPTMKLMVDRQLTPGWVHRETHGYSMIITCNDSHKRESYFVNVLGEKGMWVRDCGNWTAPRFPIMAMGDYNPPCTFITPGEQPETKLPERNLIAEPHFIEFTADDGKRLRVSR